MRLMLFIPGGLSCAASRVIPRVAADTGEQRIVFDRTQSAVPLPIGALQPLERLVLLAAPRIGLGDLVRGALCTLSMRNRGLERNGEAARRDRHWNILTAWLASLSQYERRR